MMRLTVATVYALDICFWAYPLDAGIRSLGISAKAVNTFTIESAGASLLLSRELPLGGQMEREPVQIERSVFENYDTYLQDKHRPPSRGGNTRAWHSHVLTIEGERYSFLALGSKRWAYSRDTISFQWSFDPSGIYRNIDCGSIRTWTKAGDPVQRGERGTKPWRTAPARMPASRREQRG